MLHDPKLDRVFRPPSQRRLLRHSFAPMATTFLVEHLPHAKLGPARADNVDLETRKGIGTSPPNSDLEVIPVPDRWKIIFKRQKQLRRLSLGSCDVASGLLRGTLGKAFR